jgi:hypothetical protein
MVNFGGFAKKRPSIYFHLNDLITGILYHSDDMNSGFAIVIFILFHLVSMV